MTDMQEKLIQDMRDTGRTARRELTMAEKAAKHHDFQEVCKHADRLMRTLQFRSDGIRETAHQALGDAAAIAYIDSVHDRVWRCVNAVSRLGKCMYETDDDEYIAAQIESIENDVVKTAYHGVNGQTPRDRSELTGRTVRLSAWAGGPLKEAVVTRVDDSVLTYTEDNGASYSLLPVDALTVSEDADGGITIGWKASRDTHADMCADTCADDMSEADEAVTGDDAGQDGTDGAAPVSGDTAGAQVTGDGARVIDRTAKLEARRARVQERMAAGELGWVGQVISGHGWSISADGDACRIIVRIDAGTGNRANVHKAREAVKAAGWYYTATLNAWTRGLRCKAWRAAQGLAATLTGILG